MPHVYSTISTDVSYTFYGEKTNDMPSVKNVIVINGGANVAKKNLETPRGVATKITDEEAELLSGHPVFRRHLENGFVQLEATSVDPERAAADMTPADNSAPLTDSDFDQEDEPKPQTGTRKK